MPAQSSLLLQLAACASSGLVLPCFLGGLDGVHGFAASQAGSVYSQSYTFPVQGAKIAHLIVAANRTAPLQLALAPSACKLNRALFKTISCCKHALEAKPLTYDPAMLAKCHWLISLLYGLLIGHEALSITGHEAHRQYRMLREESVRPGFRYTQLCISSS